MGVGVATFPTAALVSTMILSFSQTVSLLSPRSTSVRRHAALEN
jgi:hypothetical protein